MPIYYYYRLIFSQSLLSLDLIEAYLDHVDSQYDELLNNKDKDIKEDDKDKEDKKEETDKPETANTVSFNQTVFKSIFPWLSVQ